MSTQLDWAEIMKVADESVEKYQNEKNNINKQSGAMNVSSMSYDIDLFTYL